MFILFSLSFKLFNTNKNNRKKITRILNFYKIDSNFTIHTLFLASINNYKVSISPREF